MAALPSAIGWAESDNSSGQYVELKLLIDILTANGQPVSNPHNLDLNGIDVLVSGSPYPVSIDSLNRALGTQGLFIEPLPFSRQWTLSIRKPRRTSASVPVRVSGAPLRGSTVIQINRRFYLVEGNETIYLPEASLPNTRPLEAHGSPDSE